MKNSISRSEKELKGLQSKRSSHNYSKNTEGTFKYKHIRHNSGFNLKYN
jgi:hypothetical protein